MVRRTDRQELRRKRRKRIGNRWVVNRLGGWLKRRTDRLRREKPEDGQSVRAVSQIHIKAGVGQITAKTTSAHLGVKVIGCLLLRLRGRRLRFPLLWDPAGSRVVNCSAAVGVDERFTCGEQST